ncbi:hypothetical protein [Paucibacter soli]|uniref:hypothetical protein n=1 Tax=Paucibacter soli TaxID=3133433 RepID=UPI0030B72BFB
MENEQARTTPGAESQQQSFDDSAALLMVKLISDLDAVIQELLRILPTMQPWQRQLRALLTQADVQMQILRMTEAMEKDAREIVAATERLGATCRAVNVAIRGSRANESVRSLVLMISRIGDTLARLMDTECKNEGASSKGALSAP